MSKKEVFKLVWRGWFVAANILFIPAIIIFATQSERLPDNFYYFFLLIPLVAAMQGILIGGLITFGLTIWPPK